MQTNSLASVIMNVFKSPDNWISKQQITDDFECLCKKYAGQKYRSIICEQCGTTVGKLKENRLWLSLMLYKAIYADQYFSLAVDADAADSFRKVLMAVLTDLIKSQLESPIPWSAYQPSAENAIYETSEDDESHVLSIYRSRSVSLIPLMKSNDCILIAEMLSEQSGYGHHEAIWISQFVEVAQVEIAESFRGKKIDQPPTVKGRFLCMIGLMIAWALRISLVPVLIIFSALDLYLCYDSLMNRGFFAFVLMVVVGLPLLTGIELVLCIIISSPFFVLSGYLTETYKCHGEKNTEVP